MSSVDLDGFVNVTLSVRTYLGKSGNNVVLYDAPVDVPAWLTRKQTFVRDANGEQVVSSANASVQDTTLADTLAPKSEVTIPGQDAPTTIITRQVSSGGSLIDGLDRVRIFLQ